MENDTPVVKASKDSRRWNERKSAFFTDDFYTSFSSAVVRME
jgi:hypothetical protein